MKDLRLRIKLANRPLIFAPLPTSLQLFHLGNLLRGHIKQLTHFYRSATVLQLVSELISKCLRDHGPQMLKLASNLHFDQSSILSNDYMDRSIAPTWSGTAVINVGTGKQPAHLPDNLILMTLRLDDDATSSDVLNLTKAASLPLQFLDNRSR